jgi:hypothetical protein
MTFRVFWDAVPCSHVEIDRCFGRSGDRSGLLWGSGDSLQWTESPSDLPVTIAILLESVPEKL